MRMERSSVPLLLKLLVVYIFAIVGLYKFSSSFFLAKRSLPYKSKCHDGKRLLQSALGLSEDEVKHIPEGRSGCWMDRRVDQMVILVVDALRFDFARYYLPESVGVHLKSSQTEKSSQLMQFMADPPTVTMQRLKGLTTGGLPTFADISGNLGGGYVDEDSWVDQFVSQGRKAGFVGDDTWVDLFPTQFAKSYPYPSFNTRDLDTVDNGCWEHLPELLEDLEAGSLELVVTHFLGVDHVGHTYGPHTKFMDQKLHQMDVTLKSVMEQLDARETCTVTFVMGDHGMTEDGNHGGGSAEEVGAALFSHFSPSCGAGEHLMTGSALGKEEEDRFQSIHQIDLVPTISLLLGLPIPYANLGGVVPSLFPGPPRDVAAALAYNSAQVWTYFQDYSTQANRLPHLEELGEYLKDAVAAYKKALEFADVPTSMDFQKACIKFKVFLVEASELGKRVWTRFDSAGMVLGTAIILVCLCVSSYYQKIERSPVLELTLTAVFMVFHCVLLTFSNSYIAAEQFIVMFALSILGIVIAGRLHVVRRATVALVPLLVPISARLHELFVSGHGLDPAIPLHTAHNSVVFLLALLALSALRTKIGRSRLHLLADLLAMAVLAKSWWEKRLPDTTRNGYIECRIVLLILLLGLIAASIDAVRRPVDGSRVEAVIKVAMAIMVVTGPSSAATMVLFSVQCWALYIITASAQEWKISDSIAAFLWRLSIRHVFFATNHGCAFQKLQLSSAFIATMEFFFATGGVSLFLNTFGWEILGAMLVWRTSNRKVWQWYCLFQLLETASSCVSVSVMRRHLMVWAVFAPRFLFAAVFLAINVVAQGIALRFS